MNTANPRVDFFFDKASKWQEEYEQLRSIVLDCGLTEMLKWGCPCYMDDKSNIVLIHGFKDYCALLFFKGVLLSDPHRVLIQQTANVQSARQMRFTSLKEIQKQERIIKAYVKEAVKVEKAGAKVKFKKPTEFKVAPEFQSVLDENPAVKKAFYQLTPGRQRGYLLHFAAPKLAKTRESRVEKSIKQILKGKGLDD